MLQSDPIASLLETLRRAQDGAAASFSSSSSTSRQPTKSQAGSFSQPYKPSQYSSSSSASAPLDDEYDPSRPQLSQPPPPSYRAPKAKVDLKTLSFPQSLPYLAQLAEDPVFIQKLNAVRIYSYSLRLDLERPPLPPEDSILTPYLCPPIRR